MSTETVSHLQEEPNPLREAAGAADEQRSVAVDVSNVQLGSSVHQQLHRLVKGQTTFFYFFHLIICWVLHYPL